MKEGDGVMADKGFPIEKVIEAVGLKLNIPPFTSCTSQMTTSEVSETIKIAKHRVHVENNLKYCLER